MNESTEKEHLLVKRNSSELRITMVSKSDHHRGVRRRQHEMDPTVTSRSAEYIPVLGMPTHVIKYGSINLETKAVFLIIPGNPGVAEYYDQFSHYLYEESAGRIPVWTVSHAGHHVMPEAGNKSLYSLLSNEVCTLEGQINHKIKFVEENIPNDVQLFFIGHSIGCYMILKMIDSLKPSGYQVGRCFLLFPTIERMAVSPNGKIYTPALKYFRWLGPLVVSALSWLPERLKLWLIRSHFRGDTPQCVYTATRSLLDPFAVSNSLFMANQEMRIVDKLDTELVQRHLDCLSFYYGQTDEWCPQQYYTDIKDRYPDGDFRLCENGHDHAFVVSSASNEDLADILWKWVQPSLQS